MTAKISSEIIVVKDGKSTFKVPVFYVNGAKSGKSLTLIAGQHGTELTGVEVVRRILDQIQASEINGTLIAVPAANTLALQLREHHFLFDRKNKKLSECSKRIREKSRYNMNRLWPGNKKGTILEKLCAKVWEKAVLPGDFIVDFHAYARNSVSSVYFFDEKSSEMAKVFDFGYICDVTSCTHLDNTLSREAVKTGRQSLTVEFSGDSEIIEEEVERGIRGVKNLMKRLDILPGKEVYRKKQYVFTPGETVSTVIDSPDTGLVVHYKNLLGKVRKDDRLCGVFNLEKGKIEQFVKAPFDGYLNYRSSKSMIKKGEPLSGVAQLKKK